MLAVAIGAIALDTALLGLIAPLLPTLEQRVDASEAELGLALGAYGLPILVASLWLGRVADSVGRRPLLLGGLLLTAVGSVLIAEAGSLPPLIGGRAIQGLGSAASWIAALALVSDLAPPGRKGESIGYALAANSVGAIGGPALGGVTGGELGFAFPFFLVAGLALGLAAAAYAVLPRIERPAQRGAEQRERTPLRALAKLVLSPRLLPATVSVVAGATALGLVEVVAPLDADERLGLSAATIGALFAATIALDAAAAPIAGRAGDRIGRLPVALAGLSLLAVSMVLLALLGGVAGFVVGLAAFGVGSSTMFAAAVPWLDDGFGALDKGFAYGFLNLLYALGYALGPIGGGAGLEATGATTVYLISAALLATLALLVFARGGSGRGQRPSGSAAGRVSVSSVPPG